VVVVVVVSERSYTAAAAIIYATHITDCKKKRHECRKTAYFFGNVWKTKKSKIWKI
jgi:hypothetical protein